MLCYLELISFLKIGSPTGTAHDVSVKKPLEAFLSFAFTRYMLSISIFGQNFGPLASGSMNENKTAH